MEALPESLIESEILKRLPAKSVGRFKCVCKRWNSFLSTARFGRTHHQHRGTTIDDHKLLVIDGSTLLKIPFIDTIPSDPNPDPSDGEAIVLASLDGLVLFALKTTKGGPTELVFWNPLTRVYRKLSSSSCIDPDLDIFFYTTSPDVVGFFKTEDDDYRLVYLKHGGDFGAYIYSHRLDTWKEIEIDLSSFAFNRAEKGGYCEWSPATLFGDCLYFTVTANYWVPSSRGWIVCFDVKTESFRKIQFPDDAAGSKDYCGSLVVLNGRLHLCVTYVIKDDLKQQQHGDLWRMELDGDGWVKVAAFSDPPYNKAWHWQKICTATAGNWVAVLDQENNSFRKLNTDDFTSYYRYFCSTTSKYRHSRIIYVETLMSP